MGFVATVSAVGVIRIEGSETGRTGKRFLSYADSERSNTPCGTDIEETRRMDGTTLNELPPGASKPAMDAIP